MNLVIDLISGLFCIMFLLLMCFIFGEIYRSFQKDKPNYSTIISGFVIFFAILEIISLPIILLHLSFQLLQFLYIGLCVVASILYVIIAKRNNYLLEYRTMFEEIRSHVQAERFYRLTLIIVVGLMFFQTIATAYFSSGDRDDIFYLTLVNSSIDSKSMYSFDPSTGEEDIQYMPIYMLNSWEAIQSVLAKTFDISPLALAHTFLPAFLVIISYFAYAYLADYLVPKNYVAIALIILIIFYILSNYSQEALGRFTLRFWQGKVTIIHIILPYLTAFFYTYLKKPTFLNFLLIIMISISGLVFSPIVIYLIPMLITTMILIEILELKKITIPLIKLLLLFIPLGLSAITIYIKVHNGYGYNVDLAFNPLHFLDYIQKGLPIYITYLMGMFFLLFRGNKQQVKILVLMPLLLLVTFWNPYLKPIITQITSNATYYRIFWLLPLGIGLATFFVKLIIENKYIGVVLVVLFIGYMSVAYGPIYKWYIPINLEKIPKSELEVIEQINKSNIINKYVLGNSLPSNYIRQVNKDVKVFWSKTAYMETNLLSLGKYDEFSRREKIFSMFKTPSLIDPELLRAEIIKNKINLLVIDRNNGKLVHLTKNLFFDLIFKNDKYLLYMVN